MDFNAIWARVQRAAKLEQGVYSEIANDTNATGEAFAVAIAASLIGGLRTIFPGGVEFSAGSWLAGGFLGGILGLIIGAAVLWLVARLFKGQGDYIQTLRAIGYAQAPQALGVIPFIGTLVGMVWSLVLMVRAIRETQQVSDGAAWAIVLIPAAIVLIIGMLAFAAFMAAMLGVGALD